jgi:hypothetical protein
VFDPSDIDSERLTLARKEARDVMKRCDELIERAERELSKLSPQSETKRSRIAAIGGCRVGWFSLASLTALRRSVANSN